MAFVFEILNSILKFPQSGITDISAVLFFIVGG